MNPIYNGERVIGLLIRFACVPFVLLWMAWPIPFLIVYDCFHEKKLNRIQDEKVRRDIKVRCDIEDRIG